MIHTGQAANETNFNNAFVSRTDDTSTAGALNLAKAVAAHGTAITSSQMEHNSASSFVGKVINAAYNALPDWTGVTYVGAAGDSLYQRIKALIALFSNATGHTHTGVDGQGPKIPVGSINATGTLDATTALYGDGTWKSVAGGGGGGSLRWFETVDAPPEETYGGDSVGSKVRRFDPVALGISTQNLYCNVKVPVGYVAGKPIKMKLPWISDDASGSVLLKLSVFLVRPGTDLLTAIGNSHASSNTAVTMSGANQSKPQLLDLDVSDASGLINAVGVSPGDILRVSITRPAGGDTATGPAYALPDLAEVTYT